MLRPLVLAGSGVLVLAAGAGALIYRLVPTASFVAAITPALNPNTTTRTGEKSSGPAPRTQAAVIPAPPAAVPPSFDIVRIAPDGRAVIAGRAAPEAEVAIRDHGKIVGTATADQNGSWLFIPTAPLPAGPSELTLSERTKTGADVAGKASALLVVPVPAAAPAPALAVLAAPNSATRVLQAPGRNPGKLALDALDYGQSGSEVHFTGTAPPKSNVRVYVDNAPVGQTTAGADGVWSISPNASLAPGPHRLRLDQIGGHGQVVARLELPFSRDAVPMRDLAAGTVLVQPGGSLWRLARQAYGSGIRYTVIYAANREAIGNPNLIYPGQVLALPKQP